MKPSSKERFPAAAGARYRRKPLLTRSQLSKGIRDGYAWRVTTSFEKATTGGPCGRDNEVSSFPTGRCINNVPGLRKDGFPHVL